MTTARVSALEALIVWLAFGDDTLILSTGIGAELKGYDRRKKLGPILRAIFSLVYQVYFRIDHVILFFFDLKLPVIRLEPRDDPCSRPEIPHSL
jgi:hypothetical protein